MNRNILKGSLIAALLLAVVPALAQGGPDRRGPYGGPGPDGDGPRLDRVLERLELTEDQRGEIEAMVTRSRESMSGKAEQLRERRNEIRQMLEADEVDETAFRLASQQAAELEADLALERWRTMKNVKAQLTPEQQAQMEQMRERGGEMRREGMRRGGNRSGRGSAAGRRPRGGKRNFGE